MSKAVPTPTSDTNYAQLQLSRQLCFPLWAAAKEVTRACRPLLDPQGLTYTQYLCLLYLWENPHASVKDAGQALYLDSGTLTPVLKKLEDKGLIKRTFSATDGRARTLELTEAGWHMRDTLSDVPERLHSCINLGEKDASELKRLLQSLL